MFVQSVKKLFTWTFFFMIFFCYNVNCQEKFLSLKNNEVNVRYGPGFDYEVKYIYRKINLPVKIVDQKENWRKIIDIKLRKKLKELVSKLNIKSGMGVIVRTAGQSMGLKEIKRDNISIDDYSDLQKRFSKDNIPTYTEFILGLPGDTYDVFANGVSMVIEAGQHNRIQYNNLSILPNAEMDEFGTLIRNAIGPRSISIQSIPILIILPLTLVIIFHRDYIPIIFLYLIAL